MHRAEIAGKKIGTPKDDLACLSFRQMALALGVDEDTLRKMHEQGGDSAPPRFRLSGNRWGYPIYKYREWLERRTSPNAVA
jgi:predicted DNA-binding transcriptional regulator AlpA